MGPNGKPASIGIDVTIAGKLTHELPETLAEHRQRTSAAAGFAEAFSAGSWRE
jgi:hypothetical protein